MPRKHRHDDIYYTPADTDSDESYRDYHHLPPAAKESYVDPWDLENYAYIREHLDSMELSSNPSLPLSGSSGSGGEFAEANSNSFFYVHSTKRLSDRHNDIISGDYADIDEVKYMSRGEMGRSRRRSHYDIEEIENPYEIGLKENSVFGIYDETGRFRRVSVPISTPYKTQIDRSISSYGEYDYDPYVTRQEIYSKLDEMPHYAETTMPIYDDVRRLRRKPHNFGLTNYGHLKIDYSLSWNNLNKYIKYNS